MSDCACIRSRRGCFLCAVVFLFLDFVSFPVVPPDCWANASDGLSAACGARLLGCGRGESRNPMCACLQRGGKHSPTTGIRRGSTGSIVRQVLGDTADVRWFVWCVARCVLEQQQSGQPALLVPQRQQSIEPEQQQRVSFGVVSLSVCERQRTKRPGAGMARGCSRRGLTSPAGSPSVRAISGSNQRRGAGAGLVASNGERPVPAFFR